MLPKSRSPAMTPPRVVSGPTLLTGTCFCAACGGAMALRTGNSGRHRYLLHQSPPERYRLSRSHRPDGKLGNLVAEYIEQRSLQPKLLEQLCHTYSIAVPSAPNTVGRTLPTYVSGRPRQKWRARHDSNV